jgi:hypothetical protein
VSKTGARIVNKKRITRLSGILICMKKAASPGALDIARRRPAASFARLPHKNVKMPG